MKKFNWIFICCFTLIILAETVFANGDRLKWLHYISKPLICISLLIYFKLKNEHLSSKTKQLTYLSLIFALAGDVFLLFTKTASYCFILGLISFLICHILYILVFNFKRNKKLQLLYIVPPLLIIGSVV